MPKPSETALLIVNGQKFIDWETVLVEQRWADPFHVFRFTCAERIPLAQNIAVLQFKPGDSCQIYLAGQLAMTGFITIRQVGIDKETHAVELIGKNWPWMLSKSSMTTYQSNFDGYPFEAIARAVAGSFGVPVKVIGTIDGTPFEHAQAEPGELAFGFLERLSRDVGVVLGSDKDGSLLLIGDHTAPVQDAVIEGKNIEKANCIISDELVMQKYIAIGQQAAHNGNWGDAAAQQEAEVPGSDTHKSQLVVPMEQPGDNWKVQRRAWHQARWQEGTQIIAHVTVPGWLRADGALWEPGQNVYVQSPMMMLDTPLKLKTARFKQGFEDDGEGTVTELELVIPWLLNGMEDMSAGNLPSFLQLPPGTPTQIPPNTPQNPTPPPPGPETLTE